MTRTCTCKTIPSGPPFFSYQRITQRVVRTSLEKQLDTLEQSDPKSNYFSSGPSVPVFLRKPIGTFVIFQGGCVGPDPLPHPIWIRVCHSFTGSDYVAVIERARPCLVHICKTSIFCSIGVDCSAFLFSANMIEH